MRKKVRNIKTGRYIKTGITRNCLVCGKEIYIKYCLRNRKKYCSRKCCYKAKIGTKQSPETIEIRRKAMTGLKRSEEFRKKTSERQKGLGNSMYVNGWTRNKIGRRDYGEIQRFGKTKDELVKLFDNHCLICGISNTEHLAKFKKRLQIHHKDKQGRNTNKPNNDINNLMLVCASCHGKLHLSVERAKLMNKLSK